MKKIGIIIASLILVVEHELNWLCGDTQDAYDNVVFIMKRQNKD